VYRRPLLLISERVNERHNQLIGEVLADRYPDDDQFEMICEAIREKIMNKESEGVDISEILGMLN
jgi:hypothetical protein